MTDKQKIQSKISELLSELKTLSERVAPLRAKKEQLLKERQAITTHVATNINSIKPLREERNALTAEVKAAKEERAKLTHAIQEKIGQFKNATGEQHERGESPGKLKHEIERIEYKIETEGLDFEKEKKLMKVIHDLEKKLKSAQHTAAETHKARETSHEIDLYKKQADDMHARIQKKAQESQEKHEKIILLSKEIDTLKKHYQELTTQLETTRKEMHELSLPWKEKQTTIDTLRKQLGETVREHKERSISNQKKLLEDKQKEVQEKLKKGGKLTTEDLIVLQSLPE